MKKIYSFIAMLILSVLLFAGSAIAQVSTTVTMSGTPIGGSPFGSLDAAITAVNGLTITGPVVVTTASGSETAPAGGYSITATGTVTNTIIIQGTATTTITASAGHTVGAQTDAIFKIVGGDYITIQNFTMQENASNTVTTHASNTMTEFGVGLYLTTATNGAQNNTIQNNTIILGSTYQSAIGIFSTSSSSVTNGTLEASATTGTNSNNKFYNNIISGVAYGMYFICPPITATVFETGIDIGGTISGTGNNITFGNATTATLTWNRFSTTQPAGITFRNGGAGSNVRYNTINSNSLTYAQSGGIGGIITTLGTAATGVTYTTTWRNNNITLTNNGTTLIYGMDFGYGLSTGTIVGSDNTININNTPVAAVSTAIIGIKANYASATNTLSTNTITTTQNPTTTGSTTRAVTGITAAGVGTTVTVNSNIITFKQSAPTGTATYGSGAMTYIDVGAASGTVNVNSNQLLTTGSTIRSTGACIGVNHTSGTITVGITINLNTITIDRVAASGTITGTNETTTPSTVAHTITNNNITFSNLSGTSAANGISTLGGASSTGTVKAINSNTINISGTHSGTSIGIQTGYSYGNMNNNSVTISCAAPTVVGYQATGTGAGAYTMTGNSLSLTSSTTSPTSMIGFNVGATGPFQIYSNTFTAMNFTGIITGAPTVSGISVAAGTGNNIYNNNITNVTTGAATSSASPVIRGIAITGGTSTNVYKNRIFGISSPASGTSTFLSGIFISGGTTNNIYNNYISDLKVTTASANLAVAGIYLSAGTTDNVFYNTVYLNATSSGINFGTAAIYASTTPTVDLRNNIFVNSSTPNGTGLSTAYYRSSTTLTTYSANSNNNLFYAGTPGVSNVIFYDNTNSDQTIAAYKTRVASRDAASFSENPPFVNVATTPYDLHLQTTLPTQCESGGSPVSSPSITDDFDGNIRNVTTPDVGADEGNFTGLDMTAPTISYTALGNTSGTGNRTLTTSITDFSGVPTSGLGLPVLYWKIDAGSYTAATASYISGSTYEFTFGSGVATGNVVSYYVVAQDMAGTPNVGAFPSGGASGFSANPPAASTPPTTPSSYTILQAPLNGDYTVGTLLFNKVTGRNITFEKVITKVMKDVPVYEEETKEKEFENKIIGYKQIEVEEISWIPMDNGRKYTGDLFVKKSENPNFNYPRGVNGIYATITAAVADLNLRGVSGPVRFLLNDPTYTTGETFPITIDITSPDLPTATNTVTIKPNTGVTSSISGSSTTSLFKLNGADYIIIDGSNAVSGTTKDMTITNTSATGSVIWLASKGTGAGATNNTIKNTIITGGSLASGNYGITVGGATIGTSGDDNDNLTIQNNTITKEYYGIYLASSVSGTSDGLSITGNLIGSNTATDYVQFKGIYITGAPSANISQNEIFNIQTTGSLNNAGIEILDNSSNSVISRNKIYGLRSTSTSGYGSYGINIAPASGTTGVTISNNLIYDIITSNYSTTSTTWNAFGIRLAGGTGHKVYYNSVNLFGAVSGGTAAGMSAPFLVTANTITGLDVRNNIFANSTGFTVAGAKAYCAYIPTGTVFTSINYNDYYPSGTYGILGYYGADQTTITAWRTASGQDANSGSSNPQFVSNTDLHINTSSPTFVSNAGTPIGSVTTDYDGETRNATTPDIGADEGNFTPLASMVYTSSTTTQVSTSVLPGSTNQQVIRIEVVTTNALNPLTAQQFDVNANGTSDINDINASTAKIYYTGTSSTFSTSTLFGQEYPTTSPDFSITGSQVLAEGTNYFWLTYDVIPAASNGNFIDGECNVVGLSSGSYTPTVTAPAGYREIVGPMAGNYYVGQGYSSPNYATITAAFADLQTRGVSGAVNLILTNNAATPYNTANGETFPLALNTISGASGTNTITMKPNTGVTPIITGSSANSIIKLNGTDYFTIDGSNSGSTDRSLTIENTNAATTTASVWLASTGVGAGATYNTIKNCNLKTGNIGTAANTFGIFVGGATINTAGSDNDNNTIQNNAISKAYYGIDVWGVSGSTSDNLNITGNVIGSGTATDYISFKGIYVSYATSLTISQNTIYNIISSEAVILRGIDIGTSVSTATIERNYIYDIQNSTTTGFRSGQGIAIGTGAAGSNISVYNNIMYGFKGHGSGTATNNMWGIILLSGGGYNIYYNSINMYQNGTSTGSTDLNGALYIASTVTALDIRNNVFKATGNPGYMTLGYMYGVYSLAANTAFTTINRNDYYVSGTRSMLGYIAATNQATLAAWQTATTQDANSISADPLFASNTLLRPGTTSPVLNAGTPIGTVTIDYLGVTRNATTPTIGAYEQGVDAAGPSITYTAIPNTTSTSNVVLSGFAAITDVSGVNVTSGTAPRLYFKKSTDANTYAGNTSGDNGWKWVEASNASTPFDFTIDYGIINGGSVVLNDIIQYFVVAQDLATTPNVGINSGTFAATPTSVDLTAGAFPLTGTINQYKIVGGALSGTYTVGLTAFNKATGKNLYLQTFTRKVNKEVFDAPITQKQINKTEISKDNLNTNKTDVLEKDNIVQEQKGKVNTNVVQDLTTKHIAETDNSTKRFETVVEEYQVIMENGKPYTGDNKIYLNGNGNTRGDEPNGVYSTITAAITDLSERGVSGAVVFSLVDGTYPTETYPFVINSVSGVSATNTVTIKPASGVSPVISGASASGPIFKIYNTNYVTIDGSNNGTTSRDMTIENTSVTTPQVIWIGSNGTTPITNVTLKNCNLKNGVNSSSAVVVSDGNASGTAGYFNNVTIQNNSLKQAYIGIYTTAVVASGNGSGLNISNNDLNFSGADAIRLCAIYLQGIDGSTVSNNNIGNNANTVDASNLTGIWLATGAWNSTVSGNTITTISGTATGPRGIYLSGGVVNSNINITNNTVSGLSTASTLTSIGIAVTSTTTGVNITKNRVYDISNSNTGGYNAYGINLASSSATANVNVINNLVYNVYGYGWASQTTDNGYGIYITSGGTYNIYNNSVSLTTEQTSATGVPACIYIASAVTSLDIRNNVFQTNQTIGTNRYAIICNSANTAFTNIDFNNYYTTGTNIGYINAANVTNLAAWSTASGQDKYSVSGNSGFTSSTNLVPDPANANSWVLSGNGSHLASVTDDCTGSPRPTDVNEGAPDIGAYEFGVPSVEPNNFNISVAGVGTTNLVVNGRTMGSLYFSAVGTLTSVDVKFYTGKNPPGTSGYPTAQFMNAYYTITPNVGASGFTYNVIYNYSEPQRGTIVNENDIRLAKSDNNGTNWVSYTSQGTGPNMYELNTTTNQITVYGLTAFSTFTNSDVNAPLPVTLSSFNASLKGRDVTLSWKTESEINNAGFEVERKLDGTNEWKKAGFVNGKGNSNSPVNYTFEDKKLNSGKYNYRLKQIDNNGNYTYHSLSTIVDVALPTKFNLSQNYPNPFNPTTKIDFDLPFDSKVNIVLYDMTGREVKTLVNDARTAGYYTVQFNASDLSSGTYFYRIMTKSAGGDYMMTKKMMLVK